MSQKRQRSQGFPQRLVVNALEKIFPGVSFGEGSVEALRTALQQYLESLSNQFASEQEGKLLQPEDVHEMLMNFGLEAVAEETILHTNNHNRKLTSKRKSKSMKWTKEMEEEQERLFSLSRKAAERTTEEKVDANVRVVL